MNIYSIVISTLVLVLVSSQAGEAISLRKSLQIEEINIKPEVKYLYLKENSFQLSSEDNQEWVAKGSILKDDFNETGWYIFEIETSVKFNDSTQAFAGGYLEANMTSDLIALTILNTVGDACDDPKDKQCIKLKAWLDKNFDWMQSQIEENKVDPYWHHAGLVLEQFTGLAHGYYGNDTRSLSSRDFFKLVLNDPKYLKLLILQMGGDIDELLFAINGIVDPFYAGSCSALIKVLDNNEDIFISHVTWSEYNTMLRFLKRYKFHYHLNDIDPVEVPGVDITFSSYPGIIVSIDDFYVSSANMAIIETTIGNSNPDLWKFTTPETNLYWIRVAVANRLAFTGPDWARTFALYNSGTYNNEWMILDYKLFTPGEERLRDNLFIVLEQLPGQVEWSDKTGWLRANSFWPSYNIPFYPDIYNISGYEDNYLKFGDIFSYKNTSRAKIFKREAPKVNDMESMIALMRYNDYTHDPYSKCDCNPPYSSELTISARSDLNPINGTYSIPDLLGHREHGAIDMKVTSSSMARNLDFIAIMGPTYNSNIQPFVWSQSDFDKKVNHFGQPDRFEFPPYKTKWTL